MIDEMSIYDLSNIIKAEMNSACDSFVDIGYCLKQIRDRELYLETGHKNIWEFAQDNFGISRSSASRFMAINDKFSIDGNSQILLEEYKDFSSSKLTEMLTLDPEQLSQVTKNTTVKEIRDLKPKKEKILDNTGNQITEESATSHKDDLLKNMRKVYIHFLNKDEIKAANEGNISELAKMMKENHGASCNGRGGPGYDIDSSPKGIWFDFNRDKVYSFSCVAKAIVGFINSGSIKQEEPEKDDEPDGCDGKCLYCNDEECNSYQEKRTRCTYNNDKPCNLYEAHKVAIDLGVDCTATCCNRCNNEDCGARCNYSAHLVKKVDEHSDKPIQEQPEDDLIIMPAVQPEKAPINKTENIDTLLKKPVELQGKEAIELVPDSTSDALLDDRIDNLDLSVRTYNTLVRAGISSISQLKSMTFDKLAEIRNMSKKQIYEIESKLGAEDDYTYTNEQSEPEEEKLDATHTNDPEYFTVVNVREKLKRVNDDLETCRKEEVTSPIRMTLAMQLAAYKLLITEMEGRWIPCSERLPGENDLYLVQVESSDGTATLTYLSVEHCNSDGTWLRYPKTKSKYGRKVVAWMSLPELYKGE